MKTLDSLLNEAASEMNRVKSYYPFRIVWCAVHPVTLEFSGVYATPTKAKLNRYLREGYNCYVTE